MQGGQFLIFNEGEPAQVVVEAIGGTDATVDEFLEQVMAVVATQPDAERTDSRSVELDGAVGARVQRRTYRDRNLDVAMEYATIAVRTDDGIILTVDARTPADEDQLDPDAVVNSLRLTGEPVEPTGGGTESPPGGVESCGPVVRHGL